MNFEQQFEELQQRLPQVAFRNMPSGAKVIEIPGVALPAGWSKTETTIRFVAPAGYPMAKPDCFWVDDDLRLASGAEPRSSNHTPLPEEPGQRYLWFSWHVKSWNPNRDSLYTYFLVIRNRLKEAA